MKRVSWLLLVVVLLGGCVGGRVVVGNDTPVSAVVTAQELMRENPLGLEEPLDRAGSKKAWQAMFDEQGVGNDSFFVPLESSVGRRQELKGKLANSADRRTLYEWYLDGVGVNGILEVLRERDPYCHDEAHDVGKVVYARVRNVGSALGICGEGCSQACMHGVMMEAFSTAVPPHEHLEGTAEHEHHVDVDDLAPILPVFCFDESVTETNRPGDCAHAVGHALMFVAGWDIEEGQRACAFFNDTRMEYYCVTGVNMEEQGFLERWGVEDASLMDRCLSRTRYPAACFQYEFLYQAPSRDAPSPEAVKRLQEQCGNLTGAFRVGCFHGIGHAHSREVQFGWYTLAFVCGAGDVEDRRVCIEGAAERLAKFDEASAVNSCDSLSGGERAGCVAAARRGLYDLGKDLAPYLWP